MRLDEIDERDWSIVACSAKTSEGLTEGMEWVVSKVKTQ